MADNYFVGGEYKENMMNNENNTIEFELTDEMKEIAKAAKITNVRGYVRQEEKQVIEISATKELLIKLI